MTLINSDKDFKEKDFDGDLKNIFSIKLSHSLIEKIRLLANKEGVEMEDMLIELISEGVTTRVIEKNNNSPNNLNTRNGCVYNNNGNNNVQQIQMNYRSMGKQYNHKYKKYKNNENNENNEN